MQKFDIVIIGNAMIGTCLALGLYNKLLKENKIVSIAIIEKNTNNNINDPRKIALSKKSKIILEKLSLWKFFEDIVSPIKEIDVSDKKGLFYTSFKDNISPLGYVAPLHVINKRLNNELANTNITLFCPDSIKNIVSLESEHVITLESDKKINAKLVVAADGSNSHLRSLFNLEYENYSF